MPPIIFKVYGALIDLIDTIFYHSNPLILQEVPHPENLGHQIVHQKQLIFSFFYQCGVYLSLSNKLSPGGVDPHVVMDCKFRVNTTLYSGHVRTIHHVN